MRKRYFGHGTYGRMRRLGLPQRKKIKKWLENVDFLSVFTTPLNRTRRRGKETHVPTWNTQPCLRGGEKKRGSNLGILPPPFFLGKTQEKGGERLVSYSSYFPPSWIRVCVLAGFGGFEVGVGAEQMRMRRRRRVKGFPLPPSHAKKKKKDFS